MKIPRTLPLIILVSNVYSTIFLHNLPVLEDIAQNSAPNELAISIAFFSIDSYAAGD
jgi:hypothetical protein